MKSEKSWKQWVEEGGEFTITRFPESWLSLIRDVIRTFGGGFPHYVDSSDMEQECLIKMPDIIADYAGWNEASLETFCRGAIRNDIRDYLKHAHRAHERLPEAALPWETKRAYDADGDFVGAKQSPEKELPYSTGLEMETVVNEDAVAIMEAAKRALTPAQFQVLDCRHRLGMTQEETGWYLGITREAVASRERKAVANLQKAGISMHPVPKRVA